MNTDNQIRIRMYRVGFGDCFLVSLPTVAGAEHVLIDCGVHSGGDIGTLENVVNNIAVETDRRLALVIATHAHKDHVSGFAAHQNIFRQFQVGEIWLPWTEDANDPDAVKLRSKHASLAQALTSHFAATERRASKRRGSKRRASAETKAALANLSGNEAALSFLKSGINGGKVTYVTAGQDVRNAAGIDGLSVNVLGPPHDETFLAQMDPPVDERFLHIGADDAMNAAPETPPFDESWHVKAASNDFYQAISESEKNLLAVAAMSAEMLAFTLDQIVNNTSIVALFTFAGKNLLFAGDAQYGSWRSWLERPDGKAQLANLHFYKVAHHGSLNATPKSALNAMPEGSFAAMVSTQNEPWGSIPRPNLMTALTARACGAVRSDSLHIEGAPKGPTLTELPAGFQQGPFWFDYCLPA